MPASCSAHAGQKAREGFGGHQADTKADIPLAISCRQDEGAAFLGGRKCPWLNGVLHLTPECRAEEIAGRCSWSRVKGVSRQQGRNRGLPGRHPAIPKLAGMIDSQDSAHRGGNRRTWDMTKDTDRGQQEAVRYSDHHRRRLHVVLVKVGSTSDRTGQGRTAWVRALMQRINVTPINTLRPCLHIPWVLPAKWYQPSAGKLLCSFNWIHAGHPWLMLSSVRNVGSLCAIFCINGT